MKTTGKAKNTDNFDYTERHIDEMSIVLVNTTPAPENRFQRQVCEVLYSALHGLVFRTDDFELLKRNVMTALQRIDKTCPRKNRRMSTFYSELGTDSLGRLRYVNTLDIGEIVESKDVFIRACVVKFMPIQGLLYKTEEGEPYLFASPLSSDRIMWADYYNSTLEDKKGGEQ